MVAFFVNLYKSLENGVFLSMLFVNNTEVLVLFIM